MKKQDNKSEDLEQQLGELTLDLQRTRADFENYRKRVDGEKSMARATGRVGAISQLLPLVDTLERAIVHVPAELKEHPWVQGVLGLRKQLEKMMSELGISRIDAVAGTVFNPELHEAVQFDDAEGEHEVIAEELQAGYMLGDDVLRHSMVKVTKQ